MIHVWSDSDITAGANWRKQIQDALEEADIFVLGVSPGFVGSEFCTGPELECAIARQRRGDALVLPVLLRAVAWEGLPFATFQVLPRNRIPIASATDHDGAFATSSRPSRRRSGSGGRRHDPDGEAHDASRAGPVSRADPSQPGHVAVSAHGVVGAIRMRPRPQGEDDGRIQAQVPQA